MSQNSDETERSFQDSFDHYKQHLGKDPLVDRGCCLLDGDCKCYRPKKDCKYLGKEVFFGKKGGRLTKEEKLETLYKQMKRLHKRITKDNNKLFDIGRLIDKAEGS